MEPTPPRKPRRPGTQPRAAFYEKPETVKTSADIVSEARLELQLGDRERVRVLRTSRPYTPLTDQRTLFGQSYRSSAERPPSSFSLGSKHFEGGAESRPVSGTALPPIELRPPLLPALSTDSNNVFPRPPPDPNRKSSASRPGSGRRRLLRDSSVDSQPEETGSHRRGNSPDGLVREAQTLTRRAHSGPTERRPPSASRDGGGCSGLHLPGDPAAAATGSTSAAAAAAAAASAVASSGRPYCSADSRLRQQATVSPDASSHWSDGPASASAVSIGDAGDGGMPGERGDDSGVEDYYEASVRPILDQLTDAKHPAEAAAATCSRLYEALAAHDLLGKACPHRGTVLRTVFRLLDRDDVRLLIQLARVILALRVSGSNLISVCKLVFKLSKDSGNDRFFVADNTLELLLKAAADVDLTSGAEALVYAIGSVKILAGSHRVADVLLNSGAVPTIAFILDKVHTMAEEADRLSDRIVQLMVQLTGALRQFAGLAAAKDHLLSSAVIEKLCLTAASYVGDSDVVLDVASVFSKLTVHADCCAALTSAPGSTGLLLAALREHVAKEDHVVRLCFVVGNLAARSDEARHRIHDEPDGLSTIMAVFDHYVGILLKEMQETRGGGGDDRLLTKLHDVLIKTVRVIANLSIDEGIGVELTTPRWKCLHQLLSVLEATSVEASEELILNTMATINNLSYYAASRSPNASYSLSLAKALLQLLLADSEPGMTEACRIYGNLTRQRQVRDFLAKNSVPEIMVTLLDSGSRELVYSCCGVLINFMLDEDKRSILKKEGGVRKLIEVLRDFGCDDWQLSALVCQVLWNYSTKILSCNATFGEEETLLLTKLLTEYLDTDFSASAARSLATGVGAVRQHMLWSWENEFCPVAQKLLHRIECNQSQFEDLDP